MKGATRTSFPLTALTERPARSDPPRSVARGFRARRDLFILELAGRKAIALKRKSGSDLNVGDGKPF